MKIEVSCNFYTSRVSILKLFISVFSCHWVVFETLAFCKRFDPYHLKGSAPWYCSSLLDDPIGGRYVLEGEGVVVYTYPVFDDVICCRGFDVVFTNCAVAVVPEKEWKPIEKITSHVIIKMSLFHHHANEWIFYEFKIHKSSQSDYRDGLRSDVIYLSLFFTPKHTWLFDLYLVMMMYFF